METQVRILQWTAFPVSLVLVAVVAAWALTWPGVAPALVPTVVLFVVLGEALLLERVIPRRGQPSEPGETATDVGWLAVNGVLQPLLEGGLAAVAVVGAGVVGDGWLGAWPLVAQAMVAMLVLEVGAYVVHRAGHENRWLWRLHAAHHAPTTMRALNNVRLHPGELLLRALATYLPLVVLGIDPVAMAWVAAVRGVHLWFGHVDADLRYGWLNRVFNTASVHRWHHADSIEEGGTANYGGMFVFMDQLMGTFVLPPESAEPTAMGLFDPADYPRNRLWRSVVAPFCWRRCVGGGG